MRDTLESLSTLAGEQLGGEQFVVAAPFASKGWIKLEGRKRAAYINKTLMFIPRADAASNAVADETLPNNLILALAATRLFVFELSTKFARASELKAIMALSAITDVTTRQYKQFPMLKMLSLDISLDDGNQLALETGGPGVKDGRRFVDALTAAVAID